MVRTFDLPKQELEQERRYIASSGTGITRKTTLTQTEGTWSFGPLQNIFPLPHPWPFVLGRLSSGAGQSSRLVNKTSLI